MKKNCKKVCALLLAALLAATVFAGCKKNDTPEETPLDTTHEAEVTESGHWLVQGGRSGYTIVYPSAADDKEQTAVRELQYFFGEATGIMLPVIADDSIIWSETAEYLSVGQTSLLDAAGVAPDYAALGSGGYVVETRGNSVFMAGGYFGNLYAVYEFLSRQFGYEAYTLDEIALDTNVVNERLLDMRIKEIPDIEYRVSPFGGMLYTDPEGARRLKMNSFDDVWIEMGGLDWHNFLAVVPKETYQADHPEWYSTGGTSPGEQLCLSRDPDGILEVVKAEAFAVLEANPDVNNLTFTQMDGWDWCECPSCAASYEKYGCNSAVYIQFINRLADAIREWVDTNAPGRDVTLAMFAYQPTEEAPVREVDGQWEPIDDSVVLRDNVAVFYAPIRAYYYYSLSSSVNRTYAETLDKWRTLADTTYLWTYSTCFHDYLLPMDTFDAVINNPRFAVEHNAKYMFDQAQFNQQSGATDWNMLKTYLSAKLQWNCQLDPEALIDDFFANYFREAAEPMRRLFDTYRTYSAYLAENKNFRGEVSSASMLNADIWPLGVVDSFLSVIDEAFAAIEPLSRTDSTLYHTLYNRINLESLSYRYLRYTLHIGAFTSAELTEYGNALYNDCLALGVTRASERVLITDIM